MINIYKLKSTFLALLWISLSFSVRQAAAQSSSGAHISDDFGVRIGATLDPGVSGAKPTLDAYYETPFGNLLLSGDLQFLFVSPEAVGIHLFTGAGDPVLESYGFHGILRGIFDSGSAWRPFIGAGLGFDVYALYENRVSAGFPVLAGELVPIGSNMELECAARITPLFFFGKEPGIAYGITVGIRFLN